MTANVVTVGLLSSYIRQLFENDALLSDLWVEGEVSEVFVSRAGHVYFTLRDDESQIKSVLFRGMAQRQRVLPAIGDRIAAHGRVTTYERDGVYQLYVDVIEHAGQGLFALQFELLRQKLEAEGLLDKERKRPLPAFPKTIAVVTSAEGAVWHDIQTVLRRRYPLVHLLLSPAPVQGATAPDGLALALERVELDGRAELVIVARGGGSAEDLACFNDERVARAIFACFVPVVSAIGHETDWTIADLVADLRAPTPSAAAELCTPDFTELLEQTRDLSRRCDRSFVADVRELRAESADLGRRVDRFSPADLVRSQRAEIERHRIAMHRLSTAGLHIGRTAVSSFRSQLVFRSERHLAAKRHDWERSALVLDALDPQHVLDRGYAAIEDGGSGQAITSAREALAGQSILVRFAKGALGARVDRVDVNIGVGHNGR